MIYKTCGLSEILDVTELPGMEFEDEVIGTLIDNLLLNYKGNLIACFEQYVNCWSSEYRVVIARTRRDIERLREMWQEFVEENCNGEYATEAEIDYDV